MKKNKIIVLGITGSIAVYKSCDIIRQLKGKGFNVICIITQSALKFITPLTIQILSENPVYSDLFKENFNWDVEHIELAKKADIVVIAPATANIIGKISSGIADDFLTTFILSTKAPVIIAPAMNESMYNNSIVQENIAKLKKKRVYFIGPVKGKLACGDKGIGRMVEPELIVKKVLNLL